MIGLYITAWVIESPFTNGSLSQGVCGGLGVLLVFLMLCPLGWLVADMLLIARFLIQPPPKPNFVVYLYFIGWGRSSICCTVAIVMIACLCLSVPPLAMWHRHRNPHCCHKNVCGALWVSRLVSCYVTYDKGSVRYVLPSVAGSRLMWCGHMWHQLWWPLW